MDKMEDLASGIFEMVIVVVVPSGVQSTTMPSASDAVHLRAARVGGAQLEGGKCSADGPLDGRLEEPTKDAMGGEANAWYVKGKRRRKRNGLKRSRRRLRECGTNTRTR